MDIRGIEVTNQLRSAIRAKLLELGVRYDEELPDYILVMVVNKKSRQQMHEDLFLFLEDSTIPFVDWLHDQVLKKLQKVTVAKKKSTREFVPTIVVKQEEERKKKKICTTSFLEDHNVEPGADKSTGKKPKDDKIQKQPPKVPILPQNPPTETISKPTEKKPPETRNEDITRIPEEVPAKKPQEAVNTSRDTETHSVDIVSKPTEVRREPRTDVPNKNLKRTLDMAGHETLEKKADTKKSKVVEEEEQPSDESAKKLKSCVNKPKITSVVSVKNRLGIISPRKKFEVYREKLENEARHRAAEKRFEKHRFESRNTNFPRGRNFDADDRARRNNRPAETRHHEPEKANDIKNRLGTPKVDRPKSTESRERENATSKTKPTDKPATTIKDRLGTTNSNKVQKLMKPQDSLVDYKLTKALEQDREALANNKNIKNRLGPLKSNFRPVVTIKNNFVAVGKDSRSSEDDECLLADEDNIDEDSQSGNSGPLKSHIIAVRKSSAAKPDWKRPKVVDRPAKSSSDIDEDDPDESKLPSKVIVTPRPLKPLQPAQKRATQSLLLRAVAEANQSVVTQKNPEPSLLDKKPVRKRLKQPASLESGQNLSVHLNASKRMVMHNIQVQLHNVRPVQSETKPLSEEHMGIVMSLFKRSDDNQKFLITLNGYNNNLAKEKASSDDEERLEMEVNEDDELALLANQSDVYAQNDSEASVLRITDTEDDADMNGKERSDENNENCNTENVDLTEDSPRKKRKLSPIVYNRSSSRSPTELKTSAAAGSVTNRIEKRSVTDNTVAVVEKSREKCRYWPNCTLGNKCAYMHPTVMCSAFPACKFGDKCAYKHPKCKFGLSCTKLGCVFSHPAQQCKYHPFCTKPSCPFSHPASHPPLSVEATSQRAKFTWRRRD